MSVHTFVEDAGRVRGRGRRPVGGAIIILQWVAIAGALSALAVSQSARSEAAAALRRVENRVKTMAHGRAMDAVWSIDRDGDDRDDPAVVGWARTDGTLRPGVYRYIVIVDTNAEASNPPHEARAAAAPVKN